MHQQSRHPYSRLPAYRPYCNRCNFPSLDDGDGDLDPCAEPTTAYKVNFTYHKLPSQRPGVASEPSHPFRIRSRQSPTRTHNNAYPIHSGMMTLTWVSISLRFFRGRRWMRQGLRPKDWNEWSIPYIMSSNRFALTSIFEEGHDTFGSSLESSLRGIIWEEGWGPTAT